MRKVFSQELGLSEHPAERIATFAQALWHGCSGTVIAEAQAVANELRYWGHQVRVQRRWMCWLGGLVRAPSRTKSEATYPRRPPGTAELLSITGRGEPDYPAVRRRSGGRRPRRRFGFRNFGGGGGRDRPQRDRPCKQKGVASADAASRAGRVGAFGSRQ